MYDLQELSESTFGVSLSGEKVIHKKAKASAKLKKMASETYYDESLNIPGGRTLDNSLLGQRLEDAINGHRVGLGHPVDEDNIQHPAEDREPHAPRWYEEAQNFGEGNNAEEAEGRPHAGVDDFTEWIHNYAARLQNQDIPTNDTITPDDIHRAEETLRRIEQGEDIGFTQGDLMNAVRLANPGNEVGVRVADIGTDNITVTR
jgi:hypothetical protein